MISRRGIILVRRKVLREIERRGLRREDVGREEWEVIRRGVGQPTMRELAAMMSSEGWRFEGSEVFTWQ